MVRTRYGSAAAAAERERLHQETEQSELDQLEEAAAAAAMASVAADAMETSLEVEVQPGEPEDEYGEEAELTNLAWLHSLDIMSASGLPTPPCSPAPVLLKPPPAPPKPQPKKLTPLQKAQIDLAANAQEYLVNPRKKPPYSYATLICLAMHANNNKITLSNIYAWIRENFVYYQTADPTWQNSIRHNLSLNQCFVKLPRMKGEPGKGGFWKLDTEGLKDGRRAKRRSSTIYKRERNPPKRSNVFVKPAESARAAKSRGKDESVETDHVANILGRDGPSGPKCIVLYETPPSSVSPPIPDTLAEVPESTQVSITEEDLDLLIESAVWDDGVENHLALLDSLLDKL